MKYTIGIDLGGTTMTAGLVDEDYNIVGKITRPTRLPRPAQDLEQALADLCRAVAKDCKIDFADVSYVGIGTPGSVNFTTGFVGYNTNFGYYDWGLTWKLCSAARSTWKTMPTQQHLANTSQAAQRASRMPLLSRWVPALAAALSWAARFCAASTLPLARWAIP